MELYKGKRAEGGGRGWLRFGRPSLHPPSPHCPSSPTPHPSLHTDGPPPPRRTLVRVQGAHGFSQVQRAHTCCFHWLLAGISKLSDSRNFLSYRVTFCFHCFLPGISKLSDSRNFLSYRVTFCFHWFLPSFRIPETIPETFSAIGLRVHTFCFHRFFSRYFEAFGFGGFWL